MSQTAARPWWADVQHLRPDADQTTDGHAPRTGRFDRPATPARRPAGDRRPAARATERRDPHGEARRPRREPEVWLDESFVEAPKPTAQPEEPAAADAPALTPAPAAKPQRRTIEIRGQADRVAGVAPVPSPGPQRHRGRLPSERVGPRPDRIAMYAVLLGILLILVAAISSPGADAAALLPAWF